MSTPIAAGATQSVTLAKGYKIDITGSGVAVLGPGDQKGTQIRIINSGSVGPFDRQQVVSLSAAVGGMSYATEPPADSGPAVTVSSPMETPGLTQLALEQIAGIKSLVSGAGKKLAGMSKYFGANTSGETTVNYSNLATDASHGYKLAGDGPFVAVRMVLVNRSPNTIAGWRVTVATTETADASSNDNASQPINGGTMYKQTAPAGTVNGHIPVTWAGSATTPNLVGGASAVTYQISDRIPITSVPRADVPSNRMGLLIVRCDSAGNAGANVAVQAGVGGANALRDISAANRGKTLCVFGGTAMAATPANSGIPGNSSNRMFELFPIFEYAQPAFTVMQVGDSTDKNDAIVAGVYNNWGWRGCVDASSSTRIFSYFNSSASSRNSAEYWARTKELLAAGIVPDVLLIQPVSINDDFTQADPGAILLAGKARAAEIVSVAAQCGIRNICFRGIFPSSSLAAAKDAYRQAWNTWLQSFALSLGAGYIGAGAMSAGITAGVEQWAAGMNADQTHPSELAIDTVLAPTLAAWLRTLG